MNNIPVDTIRIILKGSPSDLPVWDGMTVSNVRDKVLGTLPTMLCMGSEVGVAAATSISDDTVVCKEGQAVYTRISFTQGGESNNDDNNETKVDMTDVKTLPIMEDKKDRNEETTVVKSFNKFLNQGSIAFNRYHQLVANPKADKGNLAVAVAGNTLSKEDAVLSLRSLSGALPDFGSALASEASSNDTSAGALAILPVAVRVFTGTELQDDFSDLTDYLEG